MIILSPVVHVKNVCMSRMCACQECVHVKRGAVHAATCGPRADAGSVAPVGPSAEGVGQSGEFIRFGDGGSLFGRRVEVFGLQAAPALNGKHGRVGAWDPKKGRYMVGRALQSASCVSCCAAFHRTR